MSHPLLKAIQTLFDTDRAAFDNLFPTLKDSASSGAKSIRFTRCQLNASGNKLDFICDHSSLTDISFFVNSEGNLDISSRRNVGRSKESKVEKVEQQWAPGVTRLKALQEIDSEEHAIGQILSDAEAKLKSLDDDVKFDLATMNDTDDIDSDAPYSLASERLELLADGLIARMEEYAENENFPHKSRLSVDEIIAGYFTSPHINIKNDTHALQVMNIAQAGMDDLKNRLISEQQGSISSGKKRVDELQAQQQKALKGHDSLSYKNKAPAKENTKADIRMAEKTIDAIESKFKEIQNFKARYNADVTSGKEPKNKLMSYMFEAQTTSIINSRTKQSVEQKTALKKEALAHLGRGTQASGARSTTDSVGSRSTTGSTVSRSTTGSTRSTTDSIASASTSTSRSTVSRSTTSSLRSSSPEPFNPKTSSIRYSEGLSEYRNNLLEHEKKSPINKK